MFGLGIPEIIFILLLAVIILGPDQMPRAAKLLGKWSGKIRSAATSLSSAVAEDEQFKRIHQEVKSVQADIRATKESILHPIHTARHELQAEIQEIAKQSKPLEPETSPFMETPQGAHYYNDKAPLQSDSGRVWLAAPRLLPSELSRQVMRKKIALVPVKVADAKNTKPIALPVARPNRARQIACTLTKAIPTTHVHQPLRQATTTAPHETVTLRKANDERS